MHVDKVSSSWSPLNFLLQTPDRGRVGSQTESEGLLSRGPAGFTFQINDYKLPPNIDDGDHNTYDDSASDNEGLNSYTENQA